jgi:hypothetical protein
MKSSFVSQGVDYGQALAAVNKGRCVARLGWNAAGIFVFMRPADDLPVSMLPKVKSLPESVKRYLLARFKGDTHYATGEEITVPFCAYLCMLAADGSVINGWQASQVDTLATDWIILD